MSSHHTQPAHVPNSLPQPTLLHLECLPQPLQSGERLITILKPYSNVTFSVKWSPTLSHPLFCLHSPSPTTARITSLTHPGTSPPSRLSHQPRDRVPKEPGQRLNGLCIHYTQNGVWYTGRGSINERLIQSLGNPHQNLKLLDYKSISPIYKTNLPPTLQVGKEHTSSIPKPSLP